MIGKGQKAPDFCLKNQKGEWTELSMFSGQKVCLFFFSDVDTLNDQLYVINYAKEITRFQDLNVTVIGICGSSVTALAKQSQRLYVPYVLLSDVDGDVRRSYDVWNRKMVFGKERWITSRSALLIREDGIVYRTYKRVNIERHVYEMLAYLQHWQEKEEWRKLSRRTKERIRREQANAQKTADEEKKTFRYIIT